MSMGKMSWEKSEDPNSWDASGESDILPFTPGDAGPTAFWKEDGDWWNHMLETDFAPDSAIIAACGPEYLMWQEMHDFGSEVDFFSRPPMATVYSRESPVTAYISKYCGPRLSETME